jgi:hypothetical protein
MTAAAVVGRLAPGGAAAIAEEPAAVGAPAAAM